eukprot:g24177.t1
MPSLQKKVTLCGAGLLSVASALTAALALNTQAWVEATVLCQTGAQLVNASGSELEKFIGRISYGLFHGRRLRDFHVKFDKTGVCDERVKYLGLLQCVELDEHSRPSTIRGAGRLTF